MFLGCCSSITVSPMVHHYLVNTEPWTSIAVVECGPTEYHEVLSVIDALKRNSKNNDHKRTISILRVDNKPYHVERINSHPGNTRMWDCGVWEWRSIWNPFVDGCRVTMEL